MFTFRLAAAALPLALLAQQPAAEQPAAEQKDPTVAVAVPAPEPAVKSFVVEPGTRVPLGLINSVSTKQAAEGDRVYLESVFPILIDGKVVIPPGSYVAGTVTSVKRPGRIKGRGEIYIRFDSLTLPNGVTRDFRGRIGSLDGLATEKLDREEGKVSSDGNKSGDARTIGEAAAAGTSIGAIAGSVGGRTGMGIGIGAAAGAAAGLIGVLASRGPDAVLAKGATLEMVLDRSLSFTEDEIDFGPARRRPKSSAAAQPPSNQHKPVPIPGRGVPVGRIP
jgi:type IV secretion system protein VirB10